MKRLERAVDPLVNFLILLAVVTITGTGWYAWHTKVQTDKILAETLKIAQSANAGAARTSSTQYFTIAQWGVRATYDGKLTLEYSLSATKSPQYATFSSTQLDASDPLCASSGGFGGTISRYRSTDNYLIGGANDYSGKTAAEHAATLKSSDYAHIGDYYYFWNGPQSFCGKDQNSHKVQNDTGSAVSGLLPKLRAIP